MESEFHEALWLTTHKRGEMPSSRGMIRSTDIRCEEGTTWEVYTEDFLPQQWERSWHGDREDGHARALCW